MSLKSCVLKGSCSRNCTENGCDLAVKVGAFVDLKMHESVNPVVGTVFH